MDSLPIASLVVGALACYLTYVQTTRFSRINVVHAEYAKRHGLPTSPPLGRTRGHPPTRKELPMTPVEAQSIIKTGLSLDMPFLMGKSLEFALFKTYGIPTISDLLRYTTEFKDPTKAGRRYSDTAVLIFAFIFFPLVGPGSGTPEGTGPRDPRSAVAVARINFLHGQWKDKISNDDLLYTLSTFILEPNVWASQYEWRSLTPVEEMAWMVFFSEIGRRMGITDIPEEISELQEWAEDYEFAHMVPTESCRDVASATTRLLLHNVPQIARPAAEKVIACLLYDRLRESVMIPPPPPMLKSIVVAGLRLRAVALRHLFPPRPQYFKVSLFTDAYPAFPRGYVSPAQAASLSTKPTRGSGASDSDGGDSSDDGSTSTKGTSVEENSQEMVCPRIHPSFYYNEPWYVAPRQGLSGFLDSALLFLGLLRQDQVPGKDFKPQGLRLEECGPVKAEGKGNELVRKMAEAMQGAPLEGPYDLGGCSAMRCPFGAMQP